MKTPLMEKMPSEVSSLSEMPSDILGGIVQDRASGLGIRMRDLRPFILEIWRRLEQGENICGCKSKKKFCEVVFCRTLRSVQLMLAKKDATAEKKWADKQKPLDEEEQRYERLYNFVDKHYADDFERLERDIELVLRAQQSFAELKTRGNRP